MFLNKLTLADSTWGHIKVPGSECHSMCLGLPFLPLKKGVEQSVHFGISIQRNHSHSVDQTHVQTFLPKLIMTSLECHMVMSWWCKGFWMMTFTSALRGDKRRMCERVGVPVPVESSSRFKCKELSYPPQEYFSVCQHQVSQQFLHSGEIMCLVLHLIAVVHF